MTDSVKAKVNEHHFKKQVNVGGTKLVKDEAKSVEPNLTLRNMVQAGNVVVTEGSLAPDKSEKSFQGDDGSGEKGEEDDVEKRERLKDLTVDELKSRLEEKGLKKSGTKDELVERLKNQ